MRILVCGGRDYTDQQFVNQALDQIRGGSLGLGDDVVIQGAAKGADTCAMIWADQRDVECISYLADWSKYGKKAGYIRNKQMLDEGKPDLVVAFPGGKGTAMMVDLATKAGVRVIQMGTLGSGSQMVAASYTPKFKTKKFEKMYCDRMLDLRGFATPGQREGILRDMLEEERQWEASMGAEYDEIMQAQELMEKTDGSASS